MWHRLKENFQCILYRYLLGWMSWQKEIFIIPIDWNRVCSWLLSQLSITNVIGEEGMFEIDITVAINTLMVLPTCMTILYFRCLMVRVLIQRLDPTAAPCRTPADTKSGSDMKFCSEMLWKLGQRRKEKQHQGCAFWILRVKWSSCEQ